MAVEAVWFDSKLKATAFLNSVFSSTGDTTTFSHFEYDEESRAAAVMVSLDTDSDYRIDDYAHCTTLPEEVASYFAETNKLCA